MAEQWISGKTCSIDTQKGKWENGFGKLCFVIMNKLWCRLQSILWLTIVNVYDAVILCLYSGNSSGCFNNDLFGTKEYNIPHQQWGLYYWSRDSWWPLQRDQELGLHRLCQCHPQRWRQMLDSKGLNESNKHTSYDFSVLISCIMLAVMLLYS